MAQRDQVGFSRSSSGDRPARMNRAVSHAPRMLLAMTIACLCTPSLVYGQVTTLSEAIRETERANRTIQIAALDHQKALREVEVAKTHRYPIFSISALASQPLTQLGITLERGSLGVYPHDGPIPG